MKLEWNSIAIYAMRCVFMLCCAYSTIDGRRKFCILVKGIQTIPARTTTTKYPISTTKKKQQQQQYQQQQNQMYRKAIPLAISLLRVSHQA